jgi:hypothetical protein
LRIRARRLLLAFILRAALSSEVLDRAFGMLIVIARHVKVDESSLQYSGPVPFQTLLGARVPIVRVIGFGLPVIRGAGALFALNDGLTQISVAVGRRIEVMQRFAGLFVVARIIVLPRLLVGLALAPAWELKQIGSVIAALIRKRRNLSNKDSSDVYGSMLLSVPRDLKIRSTALPNLSRPKCVPLHHEGYCSPLPMRPT